MAGRTYLGIPREMIPWAPKIDADACIGCGDCLDMCANNVYVLDEQNQKMVVANPDNCVVLCDKCAGFCPNQAISFPDKEQMRQLLQRLRSQVASRIGSSPGQMR